MMDHTNPSTIPAHIVQSELICLLLPNGLSPTAENRVIVKQRIADARYVNADAFVRLEKDIDSYVAVTFHRSWRT